MNDYYVYLYLREDGTPYYVGKGKGKRAFTINGRRMNLPSDKSKIVFHTKNLTEDEAFALEKELIAKYGRKDNGTGILRNLTDGGEGISGHIFSDETLAKMSVSIKEALNRPEIKAKHCAATKEALNRPEVKAKLSAAMKEYMNRPEVKAKQSAIFKEAMNRPEVKAKHSAATKEALNRPEVKAKHCAATKEALNRPEVKAKLSAATKEAMNRPEVKAKHSAAMKEYHRKKREAKQASANTLTKFFSE